VLLDFFIAGVQKGGTTALDYFLRQHPSVQMAKVKEVHFFDDDRIDWSAPDLERLNASFAWDDSENVVRGEATPIYTYWPNSLERLQRYNPSTKLIICLRHPTFRAWAHWRMETKRGADKMPFRDAIEQAGRKRVRETPGGAHRVFSYVERGFYSNQVARVLHLFPRKQILFLRTDHLWSELQASLAAVQAHLGVPYQTYTEQRYVVPLNSSDLGKIPMECRDLLSAVFRDDILTTADRTGLDLSDWLHVDYDEAIGPGAS